MLPKFGLFLRHINMLAAEKSAASNHHHHYPLTLLFFLLPILKNTSAGNGSVFENGEEEREGG